MQACAVSLLQVPFGYSPIPSGRSRRTVLLVLHNMQTNMLSASPPALDMLLQKPGTQTNFAPQPVQHALCRCLVAMPHAFWQKQQSNLAEAPSDAKTPPHTSPRGPSPVLAVRQADNAANWRPCPEPQPAANNRGLSGDQGDEGAEEGSEAEAGKRHSRAGGPPVAHIRFGFCRSGFRHMHAALARTAGLLGRAQLLRE